MLQNNKQDDIEPETNESQDPNSANNDDDRNSNDNNHDSSGDDNNDSNNSDNNISSNAAVNRGTENQPDNIEHTDNAGTCATGENKKRVERTHRRIRAYVRPVNPLTSLNDTQEYSDVAIAIRKHTTAPTHHRHIAPTHEFHVVRECKAKCAELIYPSLCRSSSIANKNSQPSGINDKFINSQHRDDSTELSQRDNNGSRSAQRVDSADISASPVASSEAEQLVADTYDDTYIYVDDDEDDDIAPAYVAKRKPLSQPHSQASHPSSSQEIVLDSDNESVGSHTLASNALSVTTMRAPSSQWILEDDAEGADNTDDVHVQDIRQFARSWGHSLEDHS
jgi:hypothetical protein